MLEFDYYGGMELSEHMEVYYRLFKRFDEIYRSYFILRFSFLITSSVTNIYDLSRLVVDPRGRKILRNFSTLISRLSAL